MRVRREMFAVAQHPVCSAGIGTDLCGHRTHRAIGSKKVVLLKVGMKAFETPGIVVCELWFMINDRGSLYGFSLLCILCRIACISGP
jgi:hypothetical protein